MYTYSHDPETGGLLLADSLSEFSKEPRPVWAAELDLLGFGDFWKYDNTSDAPYLWAESNFYWYRGQKVAKTNGGSLYVKPEIELLRDEAGKEILPKGTTLIPVDVEAMIAKNRLRIEALETLTVKKIYDIYRKYEKKLDCFHVAFSGGKDSIALLELVRRALPRTAFMVVFGDTGMEFPDTYKAVEAVEARCKADGIAFYRAKSCFTPEESWRLFGPPSHALRWCCTVHKSVPQTLKIREILGKRDYTGMAFVGVRGHESDARSQYDYLNFSKKQMGQYSFNAMQEWSSAEVWIYIFSRQLLINGAYVKGMVRVGCLFCPLGAGGRSDYFEHTAYKDGVDRFINYVKSSISCPDTNEYIAKCGWVARKNGRDIKGNEEKIQEATKDGRTTLRLLNPTTDWREWIKTLNGPVDLEATESDGVLIVSYPSALTKTSLGRRLKQCFYKASYCVGCGECEANCRSGALSFKNGLHIDNCIHCGLCHEIEKGCYRADSLKKATLERIDMKSINTFATHAPKPEWVTDFFSRGSDFVSNNSLGPMQITKFKRFLSDAGLLAKNKATPFFELARRIGMNAEDTWGLILTNLSYDNPQIEWYVRNMDVGREYPRQELYDMIAVTGLKPDGVMSVIRAFGRLCNIPLSTRFHFGRVVSKGQDIVSLTRTKTVAPSPLVMLYALYKFAEKCGGYWEFPLSRLMDFTVEAEGVSPAQIFALARDEMEALLNGLSRTNPDFVTFTTTHDLELVRLADDKTPANVIALFNV